MVFVSLRGKPRPLIYTLRKLLKVHNHGYKLFLLGLTEQKKSTKKPTSKWLVGIVQLTSDSTQIVNVALGCLPGVEGGPILMKIPHT